MSFNDLKSRIVDTIEALENQSMGDESAPIKMTEFASLTCGHCAKFHNEVFPKIKENYILFFVILFKLFSITHSFSLI